ncbi:MAG: oxygen-dependent tRNA uridine(34) hydroxylase TrhO, partial [Bacteroidia bacterium]
MSQQLPYQVVAFYKYVHIEEAEVFAIRHLKYCQRLGITGRIIIAYEGINGQLSGTVEQCRQYMQDLTADERFADADFKIDDWEKNAFLKMHVRYKPEIVNSGLAAVPEVNPSKETGKHLSAEDFKKLKERDDVVIIDVRSNYETQIGRFKNAVTLNMENFREFPEKINELEQFKDKTVVTYCTGGIKCEKASALLLKNGFKDVYQLDGGIIKYAKLGGGED